MMIAKFISERGRAKAERRILLLCVFQLNGLDFCMCVEYLARWICG